MAETLRETPGGSRLHIGVFGRTNSGKSSFINAVTGQEVSIVSEISGTTTDPVYKAMELYPLGPCVFIDTAGIDDDTPLGGKRLQKTELAAEKTDIAVILLDGERAAEYQTPEGVKEESALFYRFREKKIPVLFVVNKADVSKETGRLCATLSQETGAEAILFSARTKEGLEQVREALTRLVPADFESREITGGLVSEGELVLLVMPQDIQAPKGRLILPQVQTIRELLDKKCLVMSVAKEQFVPALSALKEPPKLIVTDSQIFDFVYQNKPGQSMLTSFSVLFAAYKGDLPYYLEGAKQIDSLTPHSKVLIAECCTHAPLQEDIGRVKIPGMLRSRFGEELTVEVVSGTDFPQDVSGYDLIIQCGACMFNRNYVLSRIGRAKEKKVAMTNYGVAVAHLKGILDKIVLP